MFKSKQYRVCHTSYDTHLYPQEPQSAPPALKDYADTDAKLKRSYMGRQQVCTFSRYYACDLILNSVRLRTARYVPVRQYADQPVPGSTVKIGRQWSISVVGDRFRSSAVD
ncbi:hypothetical protein BHE74_00024220 [Ensete ventricosum]|nr:hypothetical protein GW17_00015517 [Ensete ventricosum]RWW68263.1 hypothetical protein BHE74_00024220 [Ensete ventricosum]RZR84670.1 hypothetical protein BHM03_00011539 [Ensete ventricosum]